MTSALCWSHARRKFFELADIAGNVRKGRPAHEISPVALEAVKRIDALFDIERGINGLPAEARLEARQRLSRPLVEDLHDWLLAERARMSKHDPVAKAINYMFEKEAAGRPSPASSRMAASASPTTRPRERCVEWPSAERAGSSPAPSVAATARPSCTP